MAVDLKTYIGNNQVNSIDLKYNGVDASVQETSADVISFAESDWATIKSVCNQGKASNFFSIGEEKTIVDSSSNVWTIRIVDMKRGRYKYSSSSTQNNIVCMFTNLTASKYKINNSMCKYSDSTMNVSTLPGRLSTFTELNSVLENIDIYQVNGTYDGNEKFSAKFFLPSYAEIMEVQYKQESSFVSNACVPIYNAETISTSDDTTQMGKFEYFVPFTDDKCRIVPFGATGQYANRASWWFREPYLYFPTSIDMYCLNSESGSQEPVHRALNCVEPYSTNIYANVFFAL